MKIGQKYTTDLQNESFDAIIIGAGLSGLTTAILLAQAGKKVLVLEQHFKAGGYTHTFRRKGYLWDVGLHYIGDVHRKNSFMKMLFDEITEGNLKWAPMDAVYDRIVFPDRAYDFIAGKNNFIAKLTDYFPEEKNAIAKYIETVQRAAKSAKNFFINKALPSVQGSLTYPVMSRQFRKFSDRTTREVLSELTNNNQLIGVLTGQWGDYGLPPAQSSFAMHALLVNHYLDGANYPIGGSGQIPAGAVQHLEKLGGKVALNAEVEEIMVHRHQAIGVRMTDKSELRAPIIVSSAGVFNTFGRLLSSSNSQKSMQNVERSISYICLYLGFQKTAAALNFEQTNLWLYPDYDHDRTVTNFLQNPHQNPPPVTYLSFASAKDPQWEQQHPGTATMEIIGMAPFEHFSQWQETRWQRRGAEYLDFKKKYADNLLQTAIRQVPQIRDQIDHMEISTPLSTRHFAGYEFGELYGLTHDPRRMRQKWLRPQTKIKNLYLTGQDVTTAGIGSAMIAGVLTTAAILKRNIVEDIIRRQKKY